MTTQGEGLHRGRESCAMMAHTVAVLPWDPSRIPSERVFARRRGSSADPHLVLPRGWERGGVRGTIFSTSTKVASQTRKKSWGL